MSTITAADGTQLYYKDWGDGQPLVFSHGWPLDADAFEDQMFFLARKGYRCIAHDRRGHGRSSQPLNGYDFDHFADDLSAVIESLDLRDVILVAHSTGGGEQARYIGRHGTSRVAAAVLIGAIPPSVLKTPSNPDGLPTELVDQFLGGMLADRSEFFRGLADPFYGFNRPGAKVSQGLRDSFWQQTMLAGLPAVYGSVVAIAEADFTDDLKKFDVPTLFMHGDDDQVVPIASTSLKSSKLVPGAKLKVYEGLPHGMYSTHKDRINADLLEFIESVAGQKRSEAGSGEVGRAA
jgi:non-heme chloroperoxidase